MPITFVAASERTAVQSGNSFTLTKPAGIATSHSIIIAIAYEVAGPPNFTVSGGGFTSIFQDFDNQNNNTGLAVLKGTGQSAGGSWTITSALAATDWVSAVCVAYADVDYTNIIVGTAYSQSPGGANFNVPAITFPAANNRALLAINQAFVSAPRAYTPTFTDHENNGSLQIAFRDYASAGSTGTVAVTNSAFSSAIALLLGLQEAGVGRTADVGTLTLSGIEPTLATTGPQSRTADIGTITLTGIEPVLSTPPVQSRTADVGALTLTGIEPTLTITGPQSRTADVGVLTLTGIEPVLASPTPQSRTADVGTLTLAGVDPSLSSGAAPISVAVDIGTVTLAGREPSLTVATAPAITLGSGATIIGATPSADVIAAANGEVVRVIRWVDIYEANNETLWRERVGVTTGSVTVDMGREERRTIDVTLYNEEDELQYGPGGLWYDKVIKPYRGFRLPNGDTWVTCLGEFMIDTVSRAHFPQIIQITGRDFTKKLQKDKFTQTTAFAAGASLVDVIRTIATNGGISKFALPGLPNTLSATIVFERNSERWGAVKQLANSYGYDIYFDNFGFLTMRTYVDPLTAPLSYSFFDGSEGNLVDFKKSTSDAQLYNHVIVYGDGPDNPLVFGQAENTNPSSPTRISAIGRRTYAYASQFITSNAQANSIALALLSVMGLDQYDVNISSIVVPWLEAGTAVEVITSTDALSDPTRYILSNFTIPFELTPMTGNARRVTLVG